MDAAAVSALARIAAGPADRSALAVIGPHPYMDADVLTCSDSAADLSGLVSAASDLVREVTGYSEYVHVMLQQKYAFKARQACHACSPSSPAPASAALADRKPWGWGYDGDGGGAPANQATVSPAQESARGRRAGGRRPGKDAEWGQRRGQRTSLATLQADVKRRCGYLSEMERVRDEDVRDPGGQRTRDFRAVDVRGDGVAGSDEILFGMLARGLDQDAVCVCVCV